MTEYDALSAAVLELDAHLAPGGWDQPERLYALVDTADLVAREPHLVTALGIEGDPRPGDLTAVEQDLPPRDTVEEVLPTIAWPAEVAGCAVVVERVVLPPAAEEGLDEDPDRAAAQAAEHPDKQDVRIVAAVTRSGATYCALRMRAHDDDLAVIRGPDLVPRLLELLSTTMEVED